MNPAGEFREQSARVLLAYLAEVELAVALGQPIAVVNLTLDMRPSSLLKATVATLSRASAVLFRDDYSRDLFQEHGGHGHSHVAPDAVTALQIELPTPQPRANPMPITLAPNAVQVEAQGLRSSWTAIASRLATVAPISFCSNEWSTDHELWDELYSDADPHVHSDPAADYPKYAEGLRRAGVVVSSRLHTCVLAMHAGVPVVPVESETKKISAQFGRELLSSPISTTSSSWEDEVVSRTRRVLADPGYAARIRGEQLSLLENSRARFSATSSRVLETLLARGSTPQ